ncbi:hypothetical protein GGTG_09968 [Gaeumannomyces tritici R3-111a-1]|uniref:DUF6570 domain-containing protein n=1 Tax=Gaeumannomyces tritici (strain R3-111a-1) TaxID=644352 RepID=J3P8Y3_GAET3|nr:hypothetical protein GGTG_09968 [Gaeumannomyces tritici R3-111a-1]EJT73118.1 hypothetical protein GGTG_09968 [Gaeumannomyces tritici R3-111a-1]
MDDIHVSWQGPEKPAPSDLSTLLSVRRRVVERALRWLKRHNSLYANERGALHIHGLLRLQGNMHISSTLGDVAGEDQAEYRESVIWYVGSTN